MNVEMLERSGASIRLRFDKLSDQANTAIQQVLCETWCLSALVAGHLKVIDKGKIYRKRFSSFIVNRLSDLLVWSAADFTQGMTLMR